MGSKVPDGGLSLGRWPFLLRESATDETGKRSRFREKGWSAELVQVASVSRVSSEEG